MKRQGGFTLIELVVVIVILGILAVTAAPRFLNLQGDARASALAGLSGAITGAAGIVYGKSAIEGEESLPSDNDPIPDVDGIVTNFGFPIVDDLPEAVNGLNEDWEVMTGVTITNAGGTTQTYGFAETATTGWAFDADDADAATGCYVIYVEAEDADTPAYSRAVTTDC